MGEKDEGTEEIVGAAIEVRLNFGLSLIRGRDQAHLSVTSASSVARRKLKNSGGARVARPLRDSPYRATGLI